MRVQVRPSIEYIEYIPGSDQTNSSLGVVATAYNTCDVGSIAAPHPNPREVGMLKFAVVRWSPSC